MKFEHCAILLVLLSSNAIAEDFISTRWFVKRYFEKTGKFISGVKQLTQLKSEDLVVKEIFAEFSKNLSDFLLGFIKMEAPEIIVIDATSRNA